VVLYAIDASIVINNREFPGLCACCARTKASRAALCAGQDAMAIEHELACLVRYGLMGHLGRFLAAPELRGALERGQAVVIKTDRGVELGEVLVHLGPASGLSETTAGPRGDLGDSCLTECCESVQPRLLRLAGPTDLDSARRALELRAERFTLCQDIVQEGDWPLELIDVELLPNLTTTVLHYLHLRPDHLELASLRTLLQSSCGIDVVFQPMRSNLGCRALAGHPDLGDGKQAGCGHCDCFSRGCAPVRSAITSAFAAPPCAQMTHSRCLSCCIGEALARRSRAHESIPGPK
jgi:hypothetical protein